MLSIPCAVTALPPHHYVIHIITKQKWLDTGVALLRFYDGVTLSPVRFGPPIYNTDHNLLAGQIQP